MLSCKILVELYENIHYYFQLTHKDYDQSFATNILKRLMDQSEEKILQIDQSKNILKHL